MPLYKARGSNVMPVIVAGDIRHILIVTGDIPVIVAGDILMRKENQWLSEKVMLCLLRYSIPFKSRKQNQIKQTAMRTLLTHKIEIKDTFNTLEVFT